MKTESIDELFVTGTQVFLRTVTMAYSGIVKNVCYNSSTNQPALLTLSNASWFADAGDFGTLCEKGPTEQTRGSNYGADIHINLNAMIEVFRWEYVNEMRAHIEGRAQTKTSEYGPQKTFDQLTDQGSQIYVRTVTMAYSGIVDSLTYKPDGAPLILTLSNASWLADSGDFGTLCEKGPTEQTRGSNYRSPIHLNMDSMIECFEWDFVSEMRAFVDEQARRNT